MAKLSVPLQGKSPTGFIRPGLSYNQAVGAKVVCNLIDIGTGVEIDIDMANDIDDINARINELAENPGDLKIITPTPPVEIHIEDDNDPIWDTLATKLTEIPPWVSHLQREEKDKVIELSNKFLTCLDILKDRFMASHTTPSNENA